MDPIGLFVRLEAKPEKAAEVKAFLESAAALARAESGTGYWAAVQLGPTTFAIFDSHPNEEGRQAHVQGEIAKTLFAHVDDWYAQPPQVEQSTFLSVK